MSCFSFPDDQHRVLGYGWTTLDPVWLDGLTFHLATSILGCEFREPYPSIRRINRLVNLRKHCRGVADALAWGESTKVKLITVEVPWFDPRTQAVERRAYTRSFSHRFRFRNHDDAFEFRLRFN